LSPFLFLHGALASKSQFDGLLPLLPNTWNVKAINFSGHGGEMMNPLGYTFDVFANDILKHLEHHHIKKINLVGYSMGGYAALYFAKKHPEMIDKIATVNVKFKWDNDASEKEMAMLNAENMLLKVPGFANNLMLMHGLEMWKQVLKNTEQMMKDLMSKHVLLDEDFKHMNFPVILCVGDKDETSGVQETYQTSKLIPHASLAVLPSTPHPFEKVNLNLLTMLLTDFFKQ
jgi:pimeloyl-ACP methyl ester carboxylesterase